MDLDLANVGRKFIGCRGIVGHDGTVQVCDMQDAEMVSRVVDIIRGELRADLCTTEEVVEDERGHES